MEYVKRGEKDGELLLAAPDGRQAYFTFLELAVVNGREYAALLEQGDDRFTVLRFSEAENGRPERYETVDDPAEFDAACAALEALLSDEDV